MAVKLDEQLKTAFGRYVQEGINVYTASAGKEPTLSHVCFKFSDQDSYQQYISVSKKIGTVTSEQFKGKEITWCKLHQPLEKKQLKLEWLELVQPTNDNENTNGVANIGYCDKSLNEPLKLTSQDDKMLFRFQSLHAYEMAPK